MEGSRLAAPGRCLLVPSDLGDELTQGFAGRYIGFKARQLVGVYGYLACDVPDLQQELVLRLLERLPVFDPVRASWSAFVVTVVDRQLATILAGRLAKKRGRVFDDLLSQARSESADGHIADSGEPGPWRFQPASYVNSQQAQEEFELKHDIELVIRRLPYKLRIVWQWLQTDSVRRTARALRISPMTVYQRIRMLRHIIAAADLGNFTSRQEQFLDK